MTNQARAERLRQYADLLERVPAGMGDSITLDQSADAMRDAADALDAAEQRGAGRGREISCPACGEKVRLVSSDNLSLALWQHWNWVCQKRPSPPQAESSTQEGA